MDKKVTINFHSMFVREDGDTDTLGIPNPGELFYNIKVEIISATGIAKNVLEITRPKEKRISILAGKSITEFTPDNPFVTFTQFVLPGESQIKLSATIQDEGERGLFLRDSSNTASNSQNIPTNFIGTAANQVLRINGDGLDIDLIYSVLVDGGVVEGLEGVEMFTNRKFQLPIFGSIGGGFSEVFPIGAFPTLPKQAPGGKKGGLKILGVTDNSISSIKVGKGYIVELFKETNFSSVNGVRTLTSNVDDLGPDWNGQISSFIVNRVAPPK